MSYKLRLDVFEGPLDLLLYLIKKNDIDICDIPISAITDQYLEYIDLMKMMDLDVIGDFLVMAATLMQIKSKMLLPPDPGQAEEEEMDPRDELVKRLQEYKVFKEIAEKLKEKESFRQDLFGRSMDEVLAKEIKDDAKEVYFEASLFDLINAFTKAIRKFKEETVYQVNREEFTVEQKIHEILHLLLEKENILLTELFAKARSKIEVIVTFMSILELIRLREIVVLQKRVFGDIEVMRNRNNVIPPGRSEESKESESNETPDSSPASTDEAAPEENQENGREKAADS
jgi:segregation and condensation protein A